MKLLSPFAWLAVLAVLVTFLPVLAVAGQTKNGKTYWAYIGTSSDGKSKGIYRFDYDPATGKLTNGVLAAETANPNFLAIHPNKKFLYAVGGTTTFKGKKTGAIAAFAIDSKTGDLKALNSQSSGGEGPCHVTVDKTGKFVLAANYGGGSACVLPIQDDGSLGEMSSFVQHKGEGADPKRQTGPHGHSINLDKANKFAFVADLGLDKVMIYKFDADKGTITANDPDAVKVAPGSGPRHFSFHPNGKIAYVINELKNTIDVLQYEADKGELKSIQTISTLPEDFTKASYTAEVLVHPNGKWVYGSNRYHDSIAVFSVDAKTGKLTAVGHQGENVKVPRNFVIDPSGNFVIVGNQDGNSLVVFHINMKTGMLEPTGNTAEVSRPVCIRFLEKGTGN